MTAMAVRELFPILSTNDLPALVAFYERALGAEGPALLHLRVDPDAIAPHTTLTAVRQGTGARERTETV